MFEENTCPIQNPDIPRAARGGAGTARRGRAMRVGAERGEAGRGGAGTGQGGAERFGQRANSRFRLPERKPTVLDVPSEARTY